MTVISDGGMKVPHEENLNGVQVWQLPTVNRLHWRANQDLTGAIQRVQPDVILWHVGLPSFIHQQLNGWPDVPVVGIFPGIPYQLKEILQIGVRNIYKELDLVYIHLLGAMVPSWFLRRSVGKGRLDFIVVQTQTTRQRLVNQGLNASRVKVIPPGVDPIWQNGFGEIGSRRLIRSELGYQDSDKVVLYFGSPQPLRGLHDLLLALKIANTDVPAIKLLILSRHRKDELVKESNDLNLLMKDVDLQSHVQVVSGFLTPEQIVRYMEASDIVALPFQLVPSDAPLTVLEAIALGKPVVTTNVACLAEIALSHLSYFAEPAKPNSIAEALKRAARDLNNNGTKQTDHNDVKNNLITRTWEQTGEEWSQLIQSL